VTVIGGKGSPGATTTALALAALSHRPAYMVEADSFGGDLAYRCRHAGLPLPETPTVLTATAAVRHGHADDVLPRYSHQVGDRLRVVPGHLAAEQAFATDWEPLARSLSGSGHPVYVDVGRVHSASPTLPLVAMAEIVVAVLRVDVTSVARTLAQLDRLVPELAVRRDSVPSIVPVVVVAPRHASVVVVELRELLAGSRIAASIRDVGWIAYDEPAADLLYSGRAPSRGRFATSVRDVLAAVHPGAASEIQARGSRPEGTEAVRAQA
jgi:hypothetical protein